MRNRDVTLLRNKSIVVERGLLLLGYTMPLIAAEIIARDKEWCEEVEDIAWREVYRGYISDHRDRLERD